jgi:hypothetical protein
MLLTIEYRLPSGRMAYHTSSGEHLTRFLAELERDRVWWRYSAGPQTFLRVS